MAVIAWQSTRRSGQSSELTKASLQLVWLAVVVELRKEKASSIQDLVPDIDARGLTINEGDVEWLWIKGLTTFQPYPMYAQTTGTS